ncbi:hypothetical protein RF11_06698 [Thelohanellus kitauei]|uniref:Uncharacterized protein n=1 Tax=Thelohanellus kitauei TaxID=669202 RepID=A0A0C2NDZ7_THEKT|nr:hypothetical protein RF11_06698 [Thelohanellus kitauei]
MIFNCIIQLFLVETLDFPKQKNDGILTGEIGPGILTLSETNPKNGSSFRSKIANKTEEKYGLMIQFHREFELVPHIFLTPDKISHIHETKHKNLQSGSKKEKKTIQIRSDEHEEYEGQNLREAQSYISRAKNPLLFKSLARKVFLFIYSQPINFCSEELVLGSISDYLEPLTSKEETLMFLNFIKAMKYGDSTKKYIEKLVKDALNYFLLDPFTCVDKGEAPTRIQTALYLWNYLSDHASAFLNLFVFTTACIARETQVLEIPSIWVYNKALPPMLSNFIPTYVDSQLRAKPFLLWENSIEYVTNALNQSIFFNDEFYEITHLNSIKVNYQLIHCHIDSSVRTFIKHSFGACNKYIY